VKLSNQRVVPVSQLRGEMPRVMGYVVEGLLSDMQRAGTADLETFRLSAAWDGRLFGLIVRAECEVAE
jgi:hypothetical protein